MARTRKKTSTKRTKKKASAKGKGFFGRSAKKGTKNIFGGKPKGPASKKRKKTSGKRKPMVSSKSPFTAGY